MSTEYVSLFPTVPKMPVHSVEAGLRAMFWFRASLVCLAYFQRYALDMVVFLKRPGGQSQFSAHLTAQIADKGPIQSIADHILSDLRSDLSVDTLAGRANMSTRNFSRVFLRDIGVTPADFVESRVSMRHAASCRIRRCRCNGLPTGEATRHFWPLRLRKG